ncbi:MAG: hypothetical protein JSR77_18075 [Planctomycetes bacterium]|nr:hypothetical protein [Planctomycetota bacterium]
MKARILSVLVSLALSPVAPGQSTAFTYQGELNSGGTPASGPHDFRFRLFDAATGGTAVGGQLCADNILVVEGRFATPLDFGPAFVGTAQRFLEVEARRGTGLNCANAGDFIVLAPRQPVTPAPRATSASVANALGSPDGSRPSAAIVDNTGKIGIGTTAPTHTVHVANPEPTLALQDTDSAGTAGGQQVGYVSYRDAGNVERAWVGFGSAGDPDFSVVNARPGGDIVLNPFFGNVYLNPTGGNVGVGTTTPVSRLGVVGNADITGSLGIGTTFPAAKLDVRGDIRLGPTGQYRATAGEENLRMIRGRVAANGSRLAGTGFTSTRISQGHLSITFATPFAGTPIVVATVCSGAYPGGVDDETFNVTNRGAGPTTDSADFFVQYVFDHSWVDRDVDFIAIGPR